MSRNLNLLTRQSYLISTRVIIIPLTWVTSLILPYYTFYVSGNSIGQISLCLMTTSNRKQLLSNSHDYAGYSSSDYGSAMGKSSPKQSKKCTNWWFRNIAIADWRKILIITRLWIIFIFSRWALSNIAKLSFKIKLVSSQRL